jgi:O-antigen/teichoic acid export membrane protein
LFLGEAWEPAADYIRVFAVASMVQFLFLMPNVALVAAGRPGAVFAVSIASFIIVFGSLFLIRPSTPFDATVIWVSRAVLTAPIMAFFVYRLFNGAAKGLVSGVVVPLAAVSLMAFALMLLHHYGLREFSDLAALAVLVPSGATIYILIIALFGRGLLMRIAQPVFGQLAILRGS